MKTTLILLGALLILSQYVKSQVAINTDGTAPDNSAGLDVKFTDKGFLPPRLMTSQRDAITSPATGLIIYNTTNNRLEYYSGYSTGWTTLLSPGSGWSLTGNSGTLDGTNFIGTTDNIPFNFKVNNNKAGRIDHILNNTFLGYQAANSNTTGNNNTAQGSAALGTNTIGNSNTAIGYRALNFNLAGCNATAIGANAMLYSNISSAQYANYNVALGYEALRGVPILTSNTGNYNTALGYQALWTNSAGSKNTASGFQALYWNSEGTENTATGYAALNSNTTGSMNTATGSQALSLNSSGIYNTSTGYMSLATNTIGSSNSALGCNALVSNDNGDANSALGTNALKFNTTGFNNTAVGFQSLQSNQIGNNNTAVGQNAGSYALSGYSCTYLGSFSNAYSAYSYSTCIGSGSTITANFQVRIGDAGTTSIGGFTNWSNISDGRFKEDVTENVPGLNFIEQLRPVTYRLNRNKINDYLKVESTYKGEPYSQITTGFIAQEVELAAQKLGFQFSGVDAPKNNKDMYGLRYAEFVVPLVKSVQEQQQEILDLEQENQNLKSQVEKLTAITDTLVKRLSGIENN
ncbi:MAG: tail fiber domain-containing protein [Bacteroidetes bacterium]|nr:tail fiber domain-containing protein [Bacteroidota bacterium]